MAKLPTLSISKNAAVKSGTVIFLIANDKKLPPLVKEMALDGRVSRAIQVSEFSGKIAASVEIVAPNAEIDRVVLIGTGAPADAVEADWLKVGGKIVAATLKADRVTVITQASLKKNAVSPLAVA